MDKKGFSLVELLVALCLFSVGMLGTAGVIVSTHDASAHAREFSEAVSLAEAKLEQLNLVPYADLETECADGTSGSYSIHCEISGYADGMSQVTVVVSWPGKGTPWQVAASAVFAS